MHYAEACKELTGPISASLSPGNTASFEGMSQQWRAVGNTVFHLTDPQCELQTIRLRDERATARPTQKSLCKIFSIVRPAQLLYKHLIMTHYINAT